jgi:hypothetical protein
MFEIALAVTGVRAPHFTAVSVAALAALGVIGTGFARVLNYQYVLNYRIITSEGASGKVCPRGTMRWDHGDRLSRAARTALHRPGSLSSTARTPGA